MVRRRRRENRSQDTRAFVLTRKISGESRKGAGMVDSLCRVCGPGLRFMSLAHPSHMDLLVHAWPYTARFAKEDSVQHSVQCSLYSVTFFNLTPKMPFPFPTPKPKVLLDSSHSSLLRRNLWIFPYPACNMRRSFGKISPDKAVAILKCHQGPR